MENLQIRQMLNLAENMLYDADILQHRMDSRSDSAYLIKLLSFELLLKCLLRIESGKKIKGHEFRKFFRGLPKEIQIELIEVAKERMSTSADYSNVDMLLNTWSKNFIDLRYPYEKYEGLSENEYYELGETWMEKGAKLEEATFRYYPNQLRGLIDALKQIINGKIVNK